MSEKSPSLRQIVSHRYYARYWLGQTISQVGDAIAAVGLPLLARDVGGSLSSVAITLFVAAFAWFIVCPLAGVLADRIDRRIIVITTDVLRAILALTLTVVDREWQLYALAFAMASLSAAFRPAHAAIIPTLLPKRLYQRAIGFSYAAFHCTELLGPAFAAAMLTAAAPDRALFYFDAASFAIAALLSSRISCRVGVRDSNKRSLEGLLQDLRKGASVLWTRPNCMVYTALACVHMATRPLIVVATLQLVSRASTGMTPYDRGYSLLALTSGAALVSGSLLGGRWKAVANKPQISGALTILGGLVLLSSGLFSFNWIIIIGFVMYGMSFGLNLTSVGAHLAEHIPDESRGRVYAVVNSLTYLAGAIGAAFAGWCVHLSPWQSAALAGAIAIVGTAIVLTKAGTTRYRLALLPATQTPH